MGTETKIKSTNPSMICKNAVVKLNNPLMGTETSLITLIT